MRRRWPPWGATRQRLQRIPRFSVLRRKLLGDYNETPRTPRSGRIINNADNLPPGHIAGYDFNTPEGIAPLLAPLGETQRTDPQYDDISSDPSGFCLDFYRQHSSARPIMEIFGVNV